MIFVYNFRILSSSFVEKGDLEQWITPKIIQSDYFEIFEFMFDSAIENDLSFIVTNSKLRCVGVALNFDAKDEPQEFNICKKVLSMYTFVEFIERPLM